MSMELAPNLMTMLRRARFAVGLSQEEFARKVGVTQGTVCAWEAGEHLPRASLFPKIARILGVDPMELTRYVSPERKETGVQS